MVDSNATLTRDEVLALATTDVRTKIGDKYLVPILSHSPFIRDGCFVNMRDVGAVPGSALPTGRIYRSGTLETVDPEAVAWLSGHVKKIFDLRGGSERAKSPDPEIPGVENVWFETEGQYPTPDVAQFAVDGGKPAWGMQMLSVAMSYKPTIRALLEHVRDNPEEPFMFHCMGS